MKFVALEPQKCWQPGSYLKSVDRLLRRYPKIFVRVSLVDTATVEFRELRERNVDLLLARVPEAIVDDDIRR